MILLEKDKYYKVRGPLSTVKINNLFARSVVENSVTGKVYVDSTDKPSTFHIVHPYGMSLLFGKYDNAGFNIRFREYALNTQRIRQKYEWMQAFPENWDIVLNELFKGCMVKPSDNTNDSENNKIELNTRVNFKFNTARYSDFKKNIRWKDLRIKRTDKKIFREMKGSVIPCYFWDSAEDFLDKGIGFSLFHDNELASTAYSAFIHENKLEIGIETIERYRGKGFAQYVCSKLIDYCIENNFIPIWSCRLENISSYKLALRLGFEPVLEIPFYRLNK